MITNDDPIYRVFVATGQEPSENEEFDEPDRLYMEEQVKLLNLNNPNTAHYLPRWMNEKEVFQKIRLIQSTNQASKKRTPILQLMMHLLEEPVFSEQSLMNFKKQGGKIAITADGFPTQNDDYYKLEMIHYLFLADQIVFFNKEDIKLALDFIEQDPILKYKYTLKTKVKNALVLTEGEDISKFYHSLYDNLCKCSQDYAQEHCLSTEQKVDKEFSHTRAALKWSHVYKSRTLAESRAFIQFNRTNQSMKTHQGIDLEERSNRNFQALRKRLKNMEGPYTEGMKQRLEKSKKPKHMLAPEELEKFKILYRSEWMLKHVTSETSRKLIEGSGRALRSVNEVERRGKEGQHVHVIKGEGHSDNVFFTVGPGEIETADFLDYENTVVRVALDRLNESHTLNAQQGMWTSDHFFAYSTLQTGDVVNIYGCDFWDSYRKQDPGKNDRYIKNYHFKNNGIERVQTVEKGDEIFCYPLIKPALILLVIEKVRFMGEEVWEKVMHDRDINHLQRLVQVCFHPGRFELHRPAEFYLSTPGTEVQIRTPKMVHQLKLDMQKCLCHPDKKSVVLAAFQGDKKAVFSAIEKCKTGCITKIKSEILIGKNTGSADVFGAAILGGHLELVQLLLQTYPNITNGDPYEQVLSFYGISIDTLGEQKEKKDSEELDNIKTITRRFFDLLAQGNIDNVHPHIFKPFTIYVSLIEKAVMEYNIKDEEIILAMINRVSFAPNDHLLVLGAYIKSIPVMKKILEKGFLPESKRLIPSFRAIEEFEEYGINLRKLPSGFTPLLTAVYGHESTDDFEVIKFLLDKDVSINQQYSRAVLYEDQDIPSNRNHPLEGYAALHLAVQKKDVGLVQFLTQRGADRYLRAADGTTPFSMAEIQAQEGFVDIYKFFKQLGQNNIPHVNSHVNRMKESCQIHERYTFVILSGEHSKFGRFFVLNPKETHESYRPKTSVLCTFKQRTSVFEVSNFIDAMDYFDFNLKKETIDFKEITFLTGASSEDSVYYQYTILACDIESGSDNLWEEVSNPGVINSNMKGVLASDLLKFVRPYKNFLGQQGLANSLSIDILLYLAHRGRKITPFSFSETSFLNQLFQDFLSAEYEQVALARKGDTRALQATLKHRPFIGTLVPTIRGTGCHFGLKINLNDGTTREPVSLETSAFKAALEANQLECAYQLLVHSQALNDRFWNLFGNNRIDLAKIVIMQGHIGLYEQLRKQDKHYSDRWAFNFASECKQYELARYIVNTHSEVGYFLECLKKAIINASPERHDLLKVYDKTKHGGMVELLQAASKTEVADTFKELLAISTKEERVKTVAYILSDWFEKDVIGKVKFWIPFLDKDEAYEILLVSEKSGSQKWDVYYESVFLIAPLCLERIKTEKRLPIRIQSIWSCEALKLCLQHRNTSMLIVIVCYGKGFFDNEDIAFIVNNNILDETFIRRLQESDGLELFLDRLWPFHGKDSTLFFWLNNQLAQRKDLGIVWEWVLKNRIIPTMEGKGNVLIVDMISILIKSPILEGLLITHVLKDPNRDAYLGKMWSTYDEMVFLWLIKHCSFSLNTPVQGLNGGETPFTHVLSFVFRIDNRADTEKALQKQITLLRTMIDTGQVDFKAKEKRFGETCALSILEHNKSFLRHGDPRLKLYDIPQIKKELEQGNWLALRYHMLDAIAFFEQGLNDSQSELKKNSETQNTLSPNASWLPALQAIRTKVENSRTEADVRNVAPLVQPLIDALAAANHDTPNITKGVKPA